MTRRLMCLFAALLVLVAAGQSLAVAQTSNEYQIAVALSRSTSRCSARVSPILAWR